MKKRNNVVFSSKAPNKDSDCLYKVNAARKSKVDDNTAKMQSIKQLGV